MGKGVNIDYNINNKERKLCNVSNPHHIHSYIHTESATSSGDRCV